MSAFWRVALAVLTKDLRLEARTRETLTAMTVFALLVAFVFNFAFDPSPRTIGLVGPGIVWVAYVFTGMIGISRAFTLERDRGTLEGLLLAPGGRDALYAGKVLSTLTLMVAVEVLMVPAFLVLYDLSLLSWWFAGSALLATIGFAATGVLFSAIAVHTRARDVLLPLLFLPAALPVVIAGVSSTAGAFAGETWASLGKWISLMVAFDVGMLVVSSLAFDVVVEE